MSNTIKKLYFNKVCLEDIEWGNESETVTQTRGGKVVTLHKVNPDKTKDNTKTSILYDTTPPISTINPVSGSNALYVDTTSGLVYYCKDATVDNNVWVPINDVYDKATIDSKDATNDANALAFSIALG